MSRRRHVVRWLPWAVLALGVELTLAAAWIAAKRTQADAQIMFDRRAELGLATLADRLRLCIQAARAATGLFAASEDVTRAEWREYVHHAGADTLFPGLVGLEYIERVRPAELAAHVRRVQNEGVTGYAVWPASTGGDVYPIVYAESLRDVPAETLGIDIETDSVRREALERARDSGEPAVSGRLALVSDTTRPPTPSLVVLAPVYRRGPAPRTVAARRAALVGIVAAVVHAPSLVAGMLGAVPSVDVEVFDGPVARSDAVLYDADSVIHGVGGGRRPRFARTEQMTVGGRPWTLFLSSTRAFEHATGQFAPLAVLLGGLALSLAVCLALRGQVLVGERAEVLATRMTAELRETEASLAQDVAERRRVEAALRESEERYRSLLENTAVGIYVDVGGHFAYANREMIRILGATSAVEVLGRQILPHIAPPARTIVAERMQTRRSEATALQELQLINLQGRLIDVEASALPVTFDGQAATQVQVRDISDRKEAERGRASLEAQLREAQKMEAIGTLAGGIAHDFNNILGAIVGYTELAMADASEPSAVRENLVQVERASRRARDLVRQILAFSRREEHSRRYLRLDSVVREVLPLLRASLPAQVVIEADLSDGAPAILADRTQVHQVLMNLATNALHAMRPSGGTLTLREDVVDLSLDPARPVELQPRRYVRLSVTDTGRGMDSAVMSRIFEPFFTTKGPGEGTGLGLAVVHGILKSHEGAVTVRSRPGVGTTFELYFPAREGEEAVELLPVDASRLMLGHGEHVLLVDDEASLTQLGSRVLERLGYQVTAETDPMAALATLRAAPDTFDLLVTDLTMPTMSGVELLREARRVRPDLPVVLATGYGGSLNQEQARALGARELLLKPTTVVSLGAAVQRALGGEGAA